MQFFVFIFAFTFTIAVHAQSRAFLDLEEGQSVPIFNQPGVNWKNCANDKSCKSISLSDRNQALQVIGTPKKMVVEDPYTGKQVEEEFVQVKYRPQRLVDDKLLDQENVGWIETAYLTNKKKDSLYGVSQGRETAPACPPSQAPGSLSKLQTSFSGLEKSIAHKSVSQSTEILKPLVGTCAIDPKSPPASYKSGNPFDTYVLPNLLKKPLPPLVKENGEKMTRQDLIDIDALARTLYGEMATCFKNGLHYPMAVAKIAVNRANASERQVEFIKDPQHESKGNIARVVTTPSQFSLWMTRINGAKNNSLPQALCPPTDGQKPFWTGTPPPEFETEIWDNTLKIATEAVLYPKQFDARTKDVKQFFYTSGKSSFYRMQQVFPTIETRTVAKNSCMQVWQEKK